MNIENDFASLNLSGEYKKAAVLLSDFINRSLQKGEQDDFVEDLLQNVIIGDINRLCNDIHGLLQKIKNKGKKKRLLFCSGHWLTGGMERVMSILFAYLENEYDIFLITPYTNNHSSIPIPNSVTHIVISGDKFNNSFESLTLSLAILMKIDLLIGFRNLSSSQLRLYDLCSEIGIKTIASNHEAYFYPYADLRLNGLVEQRVETYKHVDAVIWLTNYSAMAYGLQADNSYCLPNPLLTESRGSSSIKKKVGRVVLCVGRFNDYVKRIDRIIECFGAVLRELPDSKLVLVGQCDRDKPIGVDVKVTVNELLAKNGIRENNIEFVGEVGNIKKYYNKANVLLLASNSEGFSMVLNEATSYGLPVVCNFIPGIEDQITDGENGFVVPQDDIISMSNAVIKILSDKGLAKRMGEKARLMSKRYSLEIIGERWKELLDIVLNSKNNLEETTKLRKKFNYNNYDGGLYSRMLIDEMHRLVRSNKQNEAILRKEFENEQIKPVRLLVKLNNNFRIHGKKSTVKIIFKKVIGRFKR